MLPVPQPLRETKPIFRTPWLRSPPRHTLLRAPERDSHLLQEEGPPSFTLHGSLNKTTARLAGETAPFHRTSYSVRLGHQGIKRSPRLRGQRGSEGATAPPHRPASSTSVPPPHHVHPQPTKNAVPARPTSSKTTETGEGRGEREKRLH